MCFNACCLYGDEMEYAHAYMKQIDIGGKIRQMEINFNRAWQTDSRIRNSPDTKHYLP